MARFERFLMIQVWVLGWPGLVGAGSRGPCVGIGKALKARFERTRF